MTTFRGYEVLETLPRGGMSTVFKARQLSLDRLVAIKALPSSMVNDAADVEKFMAEARITASLKHPNIVQVYDFGKTDEGVYFFVMEYISGYSIADWIRRKKRLSEENALLCALSVATAMHYAWDKAGIVHCDIKPDNVIIDGDGSVKVADLGLAKSVRSIMVRARAGEGIVFGTPNYISPEQSRGEEDLDCRADIYSLGAMLYHCLTGVMPFAGRPPLEVMDLQITDRIPDLIEVEPSVSVWASFLVEKMMAKDRAMRQKDWVETMRDFRNVRSEMMPERPLPAGTPSTVMRSPLRDERLGSILSPISPTASEPEVPSRSAPERGETGEAAGGEPSRRWGRAAILAALLAAAATIYSLVREYRRGEPEPRRQAVQSVAQQTPHDKPSDAGDSVRAEAEEEAMKKFSGLSASLKARNAAPADALAQFRRLADEIKGTGAEELARAEARRFEQIVRDINALCAKLDREAESFAAQHNFIRAASVYSDYKGHYEAETADQRLRKAKALKARHEAFLAEKRRQNELAERQLAHIADEIAAIIVDDDLAAALARLPVLASDLPAAANLPRFPEMKATLAGAARADALVAESFLKQRDMEVDVVFHQGAQKLIIKDARGDCIIGEKVMTFEQGKISVQKMFRIKDLAFDEKSARIGSGDGADLALMRVVYAIQDGNYQAAALNAAHAGPLLSAALTQAINARARDISEWRAIQALGSVLRKAGLWQEGSMPGPEECLQLLETRSAGRRSQGLAKLVAGYTERFGVTDAARRYGVVLAALAGPDSAGQEAAVKSRPSIRHDPSARASSQAAAEGIILKLVEQNPGLPGDQVIFQADDAGRITGVEIVSPELRNITAIETLADLQTLVCAGARQDVWPKSQLVAQLSDLSPLKAMNLRELAVNHTRVRDLDCLSHMAISSLNLAHTRVNDLAPLQNMPLQSLDVSYTQIRHVRSLAGRPLVSLNISGTDVSDLGPLAGAPLQRLMAVFTRVKDLSPLAGMPLKYLALRTTEVSDISPLRNVPLEYLDLAETAVADISALKGMGLKTLDLHNTRVKDLSALAHMPLETLRVSQTGVKDIGPLRGLPLKSLDLRGLVIDDMAPLADSAIEEIWLDDVSGPAGGDRARAIMGVLQRMPKLRNINNRAVTEIMRGDGL